MDENKPYIENRVTGEKASVSAWTFDDEDYVTEWNVSYLDSADSEIVTTSEFVDKFRYVDVLVDDRNPHQY